MGAPGLSKFLLQGFLPIVLITFALKAGAVENREHVLGQGTSAPKLRAPSDKRAGKREIANSSETPRNLFAIYSQELDPKTQAEILRDASPEELAKLKADLEAIDPLSALQQAALKDITAALKVKELSPEDALKPQSGETPEEKLARESLLSLYYEEMGGDEAFKKFNSSFGEKNLAKISVSEKAEALYKKLSSPITKETKESNSKEIVDPTSLSEIRAETRANSRDSASTESSIQTPTQRSSKEPQGTESSSSSQAKQSPETQKQAPKLAQTYLVAPQQKNEQKSAAQVSDPAKSQPVSSPSPSPSPSPSADAQPQTPSSIEAQRSSSSAAPQRENQTESPQISTRDKRDVNELADEPDKNEEPANPNQNETSQSKPKSKDTLLAKLANNLISQAILPEVVDPKPNALPFSPQAKGSSPKPKKN